MASHVSKNLVVMDILHTFEKCGVCRWFRAEDRFRWDSEWRLYCLHAERQAVNRLT